MDRVENGVIVGRRFKAGSADFKEFGNNVEAYRAIHDLKEENIVEIRTMLESSRALPTGADAVKTIIYEEAAEYFSGSKTLSEVVEVIENRVELYLKENR